MDEMALRLYFGSWARAVSLLSDFADVYDMHFDEVDGAHQLQDEWHEYVRFSRSEIGAICATIQNSAELRLKSIICETSPYLLLLNNSNFPLKNSCVDIDFSEQRTLDATDLPRAVRSLTTFNLPDNYIQEYGKMRRLRNQVTHLGSYKSDVTPRRLIEVLGQQYVALWPDGHWLFRRVQYDGNSAQNFFHDERYSSVQSNVMAELPYTMQLMETAAFSKCFGVEKDKIKRFCPNCMSCRASKVDAHGHATAYLACMNSLFCAMCERTFDVKSTAKSCRNCGAGTVAEIIGTGYKAVTCVECGDSRLDWS